MRLGRVAKWPSSIDYIQLNWTGKQQTAWYSAILCLDRFCTGWCQTKYAMNVIFNRLDGICAPAMMYCCCIWLFTLSVDKTALCLLLHTFLIDTRLLWMLGSMWAVLAGWERLENGIASPQRTKLDNVMAFWTIWRVIGQLCAPSNFKLLNNWVVWKAQSSNLLFWSWTVFEQLKIVLFSSNQQKSS